MRWAIALDWSLFELKRISFMSVRIFLLFLMSVWDLIFQVTHLLILILVHLLLFGLSLACLSTHKFAFLGCYVFSISDKCVFNNPCVKFCHEYDQLMFLFKKWANSGLFSLFSSFQNS